MDVDRIAERIDRAVTATTVVDDQMGGIAFSNFGEVMEFAKTMSTAGAAIPKWMQGNPGGCLAICTRAMRWKMDPFFVAEKSYLTLNKKSGEERIAFESQLVHAVIEARAPIKGRLRHEIIGEGDERRCKVWATFRGEDKPHEFTSETLGKRKKDIGRNDYGKLNGSPLWDSKPEVQMFYDASRDWARAFAPDVLAGVYTLDELPDNEPVDVTPPAVAGLAQRLKDAKAKLVEKPRGFDADHVAREANAHVGNSIIEGTANSGQAKAEGTKADGEKDIATGGNDARLRDGAGNADDPSTIQTDDTAASASGDRPTNKDGGPATGGEDAKSQGEIFPADRKPKGKK